MARKMKSRRTAGGDVTSPQSHTTFSTDEVQTLEVVPLAQWVLFSIRALDGEKFGGYYITAILMQAAIRKEKKRETGGGTLHLKQLR